MPPPRVKSVVTRQSNRKRQSTSKAMPPKRLKNRKQDTPASVNNPTSLQVTITQQSPVSPSATTLPVSSASPDGMLQISVTWPLIPGPMFTTTSPICNMCNLEPNNSQLYSTSQFSTTSTLDDHWSYCCKLVDKHQHLATDTP